MLTPLDEVAVLGIDKASSDIIRWTYFIENRDTQREIRVAIACVQSAIMKLKNMQAQ